MTLRGPPPPRTLKPRSPGSTGSSPWTGAAASALASGVTMVEASDGAPEPDAASVAAAVAGASDAEADALLAAAEEEPAGMADEGDAEADEAAEEAADESVGAAPVPAGVRSGPVVAVGASDAIVDCDGAAETASEAAS